MPIATRCNHCRSPLRVPDAMSGKKAKCPKCGEVFQVAAADEESPVAVRATAPRPATRPKSGATATASPATRRRPRAEDPEDDEDRPTRRKRKRRKQASNLGLIVGLSVGGGVLLITLIVIGAAMAMARSRVGEVPAIAAAPPPVPAPIPAPVKVEPAPKPQPAPQPAPEPAPVAKVETPAPAPEPQPPPPPPPPTRPPMPETPKSDSPKSDSPGRLVPGAKITVRAEIGGSPMGFQGDYNKSVVQTLEIALRKLGYQPVPEGGMVLLVRAQIGPTGKTIKVRPFGASPRPAPVRKGQPAPPPPQEQTVALEQITASLVLTDVRGSALWKKDQHFSSNERTFRGDPATEMRTHMWGSFDRWIHGNALESLP